MDVVTEKQIAAFAKKHPNAGSGLHKWLDIAKNAKWTSFTKLRESFRHADEVVVASGRPVVIFNIGGNNYRLITAVHYNRGVVYVMMFLTHAEYDKEKWKDQL